MFSKSDYSAFQAGFRISKIVLVQRPSVQCCYDQYPVDATMLILNPFLWLNSSAGPAARECVPLCPKQHTVSPGGNKPMCVFYHTCVVKTQHLPMCYFHICVVISTHMCERAHMCGKNHTSCPRVVCGVYHTCVGKTFVLCFFETFPITFFSYDS